MTPRTVAPPPTDRSMWRRLVALAHPDRGGDHDLFVWAREVQRRVCGEELDPPPRRKQTPPRSRDPDPDRVDFSRAFDKAGGFADLTAQAIALAGTLEEPYGRLLRLLEDCSEVEDGAAGYPQQVVGASYKQLAYIAHLAGLDASQRWGWYKIAESVPLAARHAGHIISKLKEAE